MDGLVWAYATIGSVDWQAVAFGNSSFLMTDFASDIHSAPTFGGFPNATGSSVSAGLDAAPFLERQGTFVLAGDGGTMYGTANGTGPGKIQSACRQFHCMKMIRLANRGIILRYTRRFETGIQFAVVATSFLQPPFSGSRRVGPAGYVDVLLSTNY